MNTKLQLVHVRLVKPLMYGRPIEIFKLYTGKPDNFTPGLTDIEIQKTQIKLTYKNMLIVVPMSNVAEICYEIIEDEEEH